MVVQFSSTGAPKTEVRFQKIELEEKREQDVFLLLNFLASVFSHLASGSAQSA